MNSLKCGPLLVIFMQILYYNRWNKTILSDLIRGYFIFNIPTFRTLNSDLGHGVGCVCSMCCIRVNTRNQYANIRSKSFSVQRDLNPRLLANHLRRCNHWAMDLLPLHRKCLAMEMAGRQTDAGHFILLTIENNVVKTKCRIVHADYKLLRFEIIAIQIQTPSDSASNSGHRCRFKITLSLFASAWWKIFIKIYLKWFVPYKTDIRANGAVKMLVDRDGQARVNSSVNHENCTPQLELDNICANKILSNKAVVVNGKPPGLFLGYHGFCCHRFRNLIDIQMF